MEYKNILSFDLEDWYAQNDILNCEEGDVFEPQIQDSIKPLLVLLEKHDVLATFFVSGHVIDTNPEVVKELYAKGHEIASHGLSHVSLDVLGKEGFLLETISMNNKIEELVGTRPVGFRAPMFSFNKKTSWLLEILESEGFEYDSSIFSYKNKFFGQNINDQKPNHFGKSKMFEYPIRVVKLFRIPFVVAGGFFFRFYPYFLTKYLTSRLNKKGEQVVFYAHPREFFPSTRKLKAGIVSRFFLYYNIKNNLKKLDKMLSDFDFYSFKEDMKKRKLI